MGEKLRNGFQRVVDALQRILGGKTGTVKDPHGNIGKVPVIGNAVNTGGIAAAVAAVPAAAAALSAPEKPLMIHNVHRLFFAVQSRPDPFYAWGTPLTPSRKTDIIINYENLAEGGLVVEKAPE